MASFFFFQAYAVRLKIELEESAKKEYNPANLLNILMYLKMTLQK